MGLPFRTFAQSTSLIGVFVASKLSDAVIGAIYNLAYRTILESHEWSARKGEVIVNTVDPYSTGTVSITQGGTAVTGTGTTWTASHTGMFLRVGSDDMFYEFTRTGATTGTIEKAYAPASVTDGTYELFQYKYSIDATDGEVGQLLLPYEGLPIVERSLEWLTRADPPRRQTGTEALCYVLHGADSDGSQVIEFWPRYSQATAIRIPYYKRVDDISGSTKPIIRSDVIEAQALALAFARLSTEFGDPWYDRLQDKWETKYDKLYDAAVFEDQRRHNLPREVMDQGSPSLGWEFMISHDME